MTMKCPDGVTKSIWNERAKLPRYRTLPKKLQVDVCVVGAGVAGLTTAYLLADKVNLWSSWQATGRTMRKSMLTAYRRKRDFSLTPEPAGGKGRLSHSKLAYVIQKHDASRLHYDFRLELDGALKSWAVPKGPSLDPARKALAVQVEDHPLEYGGFEGTIPQGQYGGGTVLLWDSGTWEPLDDPRQGYARGKLHFVLHGQKLKGEWSLVRMHGKAGGDGKNWLLIKGDDEYASGKRDVLTEMPDSVKSKRSLEQIAARQGDKGEVWTSGRGSANKSSLPTKISPQLAVLSDHPPSGDDWLHELKFDGYRILAFVDGGKVRLQTRNGLDWTAKFPGIARALRKLKARNAIIDGEAVVLNKEGKSDFQLLQTALSDQAGPAPILYAFDLLFCDGVDLRTAPVIERKKKLQSLLKRSRLGPHVRFSEHVRGEGDKVVEKACAMSLEGIISKRADAPYVSRRDPTWLKSKCGHRQEFVIIGYTAPKGQRSGFGALLLGYHDEKGRLVYCGRVGTGFDEKRLRGLHQELRAIEQEKPPTDVDPPQRERRAARWVKPLLVAEVSFTGWTRDGMLRHPVFVALRSDKPASQIIREEPVMPEHVRRHGRASRNGDGSREKLVASTSKRAASQGDAEVAGVRLTHPDKVLYADGRVTKRQLAEYYQAVGEWMLPHVVDRPLALVRCPDGQGGKCFFQRNWNSTFSAAVDKVNVSVSGAKEEHVAVHDLAGVISLAQIGVLELHTWNCRRDQVSKPDQLVFDLDPGPDVPWKRVVEAARGVHSMLESLRLPAFLKTSGGKGLHMTIPIEPNIDFDSAKAFCKTIANALVQKSALFVANMRKDLRTGKVYVDYNRNGYGATAVAPYSTRARAGAPVSMPIAWEQLAAVKSGNQFTVSGALAYLRKRKNDPWRDFQRSRVDVRKLVGSKGAL